MAIIHSGHWILKFLLVTEHDLELSALISVFCDDWIPPLLSPILKGNMCNLKKNVWDCCHFLAASKLGQKCIHIPTTDE